MPEYKFIYFNGKGRGELSRLIFAAAGKKFEDKRIEFSDWPNVKQGLFLFEKFIDVGHCV
jgi:glutathione S-transferase